MRTDTQQDHLPLIQVEEIFLDEIEITAPLEIIQSELIETNSTSIAKLREAKARANGIYFGFLCR